MRKHSLIFLLSFFHIFAGVAWAQETGQAVFPLSGDAAGEYIREWLVLGPFFPSDLDADFLSQAGGEADINPREGETITTSDGKTMTWQRYKSGTKAIDLINAVGDQENAIAYAFSVLKSDDPGDARFYVGSDDGIKVWINGKIANRHVAGRALILDRDVFRADLQEGENRCLVKISQGTEAWGFAMRVDILPPNPAVLSGRIIDEAGQPVADVAVYLEQDKEEIAQTRTDDSGNYQMEVFPARDSYDLYATKGESGDLRLGIPLREGRSRRVNLVLRNAVKIQGTVLMLDGLSPHVAVPVQAVVDRRSDLSPQVVATVLTDKNGKYKLINLKSGFYQVRCEIMGGYAYYRDGRNFVSEQSRATPLRVRNDRTIENIDFRIAPFKKGTWKSYTPLNGLASMYVHDIHQASDGALWFASTSSYGVGSGVSRYDGRNFVTLTTKDGLVGNNVWTIGSGSDSVMWFGTHSGLSRYDGESFVNFTEEDGLAGDRTSSIYSDPGGMIWVASGDARTFSPYNGGVSRYNGKDFNKLSELTGKNIISIYGDPDGTMWFGTVGDGVYRYDRKKFTNINTEHGLANNTVIAIDRGPDGVMWFGTLDGLSQYDGNRFSSLTSKDGLLSHELLGKGVYTIHSDPDGVMWFGTQGGVSRYDGKTFVNFTEADGLAAIWIEDIYRDSDGFLWFGTAVAGAARYDDRSFINLTPADGLPIHWVRDSHRAPDSGLWVATTEGLAHYDIDGMGNHIPKTFTLENGLDFRYASTVHRATDGSLWFATGIGAFGQGVFRYDEQANPPFVNFTTSDGLAKNVVTSIFSDADGTLWFGTWGGGVSRYDGSEFTNVTTEDALARSVVNDIYQDRDGVLWFATWDGVYRYDGIDLVNFTTKDDLASYQVNSVYGTPDGVLWFGTVGGGVYRYDGNEFINFTTTDGLAGNTVNAIYYSESDKILWFGTEGGGVSGYDGTAWMSLDSRDGLADDRVSSINPDPDGSLWFGTMGGLTHYRRKETRPRVQIVSVKADKTYDDLAMLPAFAINTRVTIEYDSIDLKTMPEKRQYRFRVKESDASRVTRNKSIDSDWRKPTKATYLDYTFAEPGEYTFEVQAIDRDLNYSDPASLSIVILPLPFYRTGIFLMALSVIGGVSLCGLVILGIYRSRASRAEKARLQNELEEARQMQLRLIPEDAPIVDGFDIAGSTKIARQVGGDFFDYVPLVGGRTGLAIADASGRGLKVAMNAVLANGMLREVVKNGVSCGSILSSLNADLYPLIEKQAFVAVGLAVLEKDRTIYWANAAQPYPMVKRGDRVFEIKNSSGLPLGMMQNVSYNDWEMDLNSGDVVVFYTDGIIEAENKDGKMYEVERMQKAVSNINSTNSAAEIIESILNDVANFVGAAEQYDDITIVVVKKL